MSVPGSRKGSAASYSFLELISDWRKFSVKKPSIHRNRIAPSGYVLWEERKTCTLLSPPYLCHCFCFYIFPNPVSFSSFSLLCMLLHLLMNIIQSHFYFAENHLSLKNVYQKFLVLQIYLFIFSYKNDADVCIYKYI